jgi:hypothetical protein
VRYAIECAGLAAFCAGLDLSVYLWAAADAADRGAFEAAGFAARDAARAAAWDAAEAAAWDARAAARDAASAARVAAWDAARDAEAAWARRARQLLTPDAPDAATLRVLVAAHIEQHPDLHDQARWGSGAPDCGTAQCAAGWICSLGGGTRGLPVELAARALSHVDGAPLVEFLASASRDEVLASLRCG